MGDGDQPAWHIHCSLGCRKSWPLPSHRRRPARLKEAHMLWTIFVILLVIAIVVVLINLIQGRRAI